MPAPADPSDVAPLTAGTPAVDGDGAPDDGETAIEEAAREKMGLRRWDRPALYRETAEAATDTDLPFWAVLLLSGAIAALGLALNATAVVIGAMLVAPLLGPLLGLSMALAIGDGRLALQTGLTILVGAAGVIALSAALFFALPFQEVTAEIAARTRPTTLDLGIAVFSGLAGAVVTVSREHRLSASIPGVAIAVALIPPLGVAGFGLGTGLQWPLIRGSLLLFGANLAGIVLSGMAVFFLVGMHRDDVLEAARQWHRTSELSGLAGRVSRSTAFKRLRVFESARARAALVLAFAAAVAVPLTSSLREVVRETRVERAAALAAESLTADGRASVLSRDVSLGDEGARVRLRLATTAWVGDEEREEVERAASAAAREPVTLALEQLIASDGDLDAFAELLPSTSAAVPASPEPEPAPGAVFGQLDGRVRDALSGLALPEGVRVVGAEVAVGAGPPRVRLAYGAARPLSPDAEEVVARQAAARLGLAPAAVALEPIALSRPLPADSLAAAAIVSALGRFPTLRAAVVADSAGAAAVR
jgi:uncharacterized hydrophobic protein (TIGR00271 family)